MVYEPHSLLHRTNAISLSFPYKRLKVMPKLYLHRIKVQYRSEIQNFFCDIFCRIFIKMECLKHYGAKYARTNLSLHIKLIFFLFCTIETWKPQPIWSFQLSINFYHFFVALKHSFLLQNPNKCNSETA